MVWDGTCGFCRYWIGRWQNFTGSKIDYRPYQEAHVDFPDIEAVHFTKASRLIETDGKVFSGPRSAYRTFTYGSKWGFLDRWYEKYRWFEKLSDRTYSFVEKNRSFLFKVTKAMFGSDPDQVRPFWAVYLALVLYLFYISIFR